MLERKLQSAVALAVLALAALFAEHTPARACMLIGADRTQIDREEALIVWNADEHKEHFVRRFRFRDAAADFGFLVPTPTRPELDEADADVFDKLFALYRRRLQPRNVVVRVHGMGDAVQVIEQRRAAGLDATVLAATDAAALNAWLAGHHYPSSPTMAAYLQPYVAQHFYVTAFRYNPGPSSRELDAQAVRMTFTTDRPFFPYAEPADAPRVRDRSFRVSVVSSERVSAEIGPQSWDAAMVYAGRPAGLRAALRGAVPESTVPPRNVWLTVFQEYSSTRGRDDLFFTRAETQTPFVHRQQ